MQIKVYGPALIDHTRLDPMGFLQVKEGTTLRQVYDLLHVPLLLRPVLYCTVNYDRVKMNTRLRDGDIVSFLAPISGG
jgi:molybdopterin converting factor small subunit